MKKLHGNKIVTALLLASLLASCALPMSSTPTTFIFPTPNLTMTALFQIPPTGTSIPQATQLSAPTATATLAATLSPTAPNCTNLAQVVSETVPDLTYEAPGTSFIKTWTMKNLGTCTWGSGYSLVFDSGSQMGAPASVPFTVSVPPNSLITLSVNLTAPATSGQYTGSFKISTPQSTRFGVGTGGTQAFTVEITTVPLAPVCAAQNQRPAANGALVEAYATNTPPTIDHNLSEWPATLSYQAIYDVYGSVGDASDISGRYQLRWDAVYLYLAAVITDDNFVQETSGHANLFRGDSVEIVLDTNLKGDYCNAYADGDDYQLGISPGFLSNPALQAPTAYLWIPTARAGDKAFEISVALSSSPAGWILEARIPWSVFGIAPTGSEMYGFAFSIADNDHSGTAQTDGMVSSAPKRVWNNPTTWGTLQIETEAGP